MKNPQFFWYICLTSEIFYPVSPTLDPVANDNHYLLANPFSNQHSHLKRIPSYLPHLMGIISNSSFNTNLSAITVFLLSSLLCVLCSSLPWPLHNPQELTSLTTLSLTVGTSNPTRTQLAGQVLITFLHPYAWLKEEEVEVEEEEGQRKPGGARGKLNLHNL